MAEPNQEPDEILEELADIAAMQQTREWMLDYWGAECRDFDVNCPCCQRWQAFKLIFKDQLEDEQEYIEKEL
jgi:hypothetical protein